jgi:hypothetical protein
MNIRPKRRVWVCRGLCGFLTALVLFAAVLSHHARRALAGCSFSFVIMFIGQAVEQAEVAKAPDTHTAWVYDTLEVCSASMGAARPGWLAHGWVGGWGLPGAWAGALVTSGQRREQKIILKSDPCRGKKTRC